MIPKVPPSKAVPAALAPRVKAAKPWKLASQ